MPNDQHPRLVHFFGSRHKTVALKQLFPSNNFSRWRNRNVVSLTLDYRSSGTNNPLLISESDPRAQVILQPWLDNKQTHKRIDLPAGYHEATAFSYLHSRLLLPFSDLVCVFLDDFETIESCEQQIINWCTSQAITRGFRQRLPKLLLVTSRCLNEDDFYFILKCNQNRKVVMSTFSSVEVFHLDSENLSELARYRRLREKITIETTDQLEQRRHLYQAYSATHLVSLLEKAIMDCAQFNKAGFNSLDVARSLSCSSGSMGIHIRNFTRAATQLSIAQSTIVDYIATAMIMDAYPPRMHLFDPVQMYAYYERQICEETCFDIKPAIRTAFLNLFEQLLLGSTSLQLRIQCLERHSHNMSDMLSNNSCFFCLGYSPEHNLPCRHSICDFCVVERFGVALPGAEYSFMLPGCRICRSDKGSPVAIKPPTAGVRIICIDGGGTRGGIPIEELCFIQHHLGEVLLQDCFDLALGTSSGGLIVLALFALMWSPKRCSDNFDTLSRMTFGPDKSKKTILESVKRYFRCFISDGMYDHHAFEAFLRKIFGPTNVLFGSPHGSGSFTKCAVTTSAISDGTPFLVGNYNGCSPREPLCYELLRPPQIENEPLVWEAGRSTSAAPTLFTSFTLANQGDFMDGGMSNNNPSRLATLESRRLWPSVKKPDIFLSLGTGIPSKSLTLTHKFRNFITDGALARIFRACESKADGEVMWHELIAMLGDEERYAYQRLNIQLSGRAKIADVDGMEAQRKSVRLQEKGKRMAIVQSLLLSSFYFELIEVPYKESDTYVVRGVICCRINPFSVIDALASLGVSRFDIEKDSRVLASIQDPKSAICEGCQRFQQPLTFRVDDLKKDIFLHFGLGSQPKFTVSNFPKNMEWFVQQQKLTDTFGHPPRNTGERLRCRSCLKHDVNSAKRGGFEASITHVSPKKRLRRE